MRSSGGFSQPAGREIYDVSRSSVLSRWLAEVYIDVGQVSIQEDVERDPRLELDSYDSAQGSWEEDWESNVTEQVRLDFPCFLLYRLDEKDSSGNFLWVLISWSPDIAHTRYYSYQYRSGTSGQQYNVL